MTNQTFPYLEGEGIPKNQYGVALIGNAQKKFRDGFASGGVQPNPLIWNTQNTDHIITAGGNSSGSGYLRISLNPLVEDSEVLMSSIDTFKVPFRTGFGLSLSQRIIGQEIFIGMEESDGVDGIKMDTAKADQTLSGTASITSNVATFTLPGHGLNGGDRVNIFGCPENRLNVGPVVSTIISDSQFTVPCTLANGTYSCAGGTLRFADPLRNANNGYGYLFENATTTNASLVSVRNGAKFRTLNSTCSSTTAVQSNTSPFTDAFNSSGNYETYFSLEEVLFRSFTSDSTGTANTYKFTQGIPEEEGDYKIVIRARNLAGMTRPRARIINIAKSGTTTATVTTDFPHGLSAGQYIQIYGVRDITNFPNLTSQTVIASVIDAYNFTVVIGTASTTSSSGGCVYLTQGSVTPPGIYAQNIQSISCTNGILAIVGNTTWGTPIPGEYHYLYGMTGTAQQYEGGYKVLRVVTSTLYLEAPNIADFTSINTGGLLIRMTDVRIHFSRVLDYTRLVTEVVGGKGGSSDTNNAVPVYNTNNISSLSSITSANLGIPGIIADVASAAITTITTTSAISPTYGTGYNVAIPVTIVSGTNPTLDIVIQESNDTGTNWFDVYHFDRITATGFYQSPNIRLKGNRIRYVQTITGTSPSFTRAISRLQTNDNTGLYKKIIDRIISLTTLNATSAVLYSEGCSTISLSITLGTATTPPSFQIEGSEDGINWYTIGMPLSGMASSTVNSVQTNVFPKFTRAKVSTAGSTIGTGYFLTLKAIG